MLARLSISQKLVAVVIAPLLVLATLSLFGFSVFQKVKVSGPEYQKIQQTLELQADILPPPAFILEVHLLSTQMLRGNATDFAAAVERAKTLELSYNERVAYWKANLEDREMGVTLIDESSVKAFEYFDVFNNQFVAELKLAHETFWDPSESDAIVRNPHAEEAKRIYANKLDGLYQEHRAAIDKTVALNAAKTVRLTKSTDSSVSRSLTLLALLALLGTVVSAVLGFMVARAVRSPILALTRAANHASTEDLPNLVRLAQAADPDSELPTVAPVKIDSNDELGELAKAFTAMQTTAVGLAAEQALVRRNVSENLVNLARRNQALLGRSLQLLTDLEQNERDPEKLHELFRVDHLTTRMRRNAESLLVLAGADPARTWSEPVDIGDTVRAAVSAIEAFDRVDIVGLESGKVKGTAVSDVAHLLAEIIENSTAFSAPTTRVAVIGKHRPDGYLLVITDDGIGMSQDELDNANRRINEFAAFDATPSKVLGLNVVGRLAARHGIDVTLAESATAGVAARIVIPGSIMEGLPTVDPAAFDSSAFELDAMMTVTAEAVHETIPTLASEPVVVDAPVEELAPAELSTDGGTEGSSSEVSAEAAPKGLPTRNKNNVRELRRSNGNGGLTKRVRGAQMVDLGPGAPDAPSEPGNPDSVMASLASLQTGIDRGRSVHPSMTTDAEEVVETPAEVTPEATTQVTPEVTADVTTEATAEVSSTVEEVAPEVVAGEVAVEATAAETAVTEVEVEPAIDSTTLESPVAEASVETAAPVEEAVQAEVAPEPVPSAPAAELIDNADAGRTLETAAQEVQGVVATMEHPVAAVAGAEAVKSGKLTRRVRGAQMPDTGPAVDRSLGMDTDPDQVRSALSRLQRGVASAQAANDEAADAQS